MEYISDLYYMYNDGLQIPASLQWNISSNIRYLTVAIGGCIRKQLNGLEGDMVY